MKILSILLALLSTVAIVNCENNTLSILEPRIVGGKDSDSGDVPYMASIKLKLRGGRSRHICSGVIISEVSIVSNIECLHLCITPKNCTAFVGRLRICNDGIPVEITRLVRNERRDMFIGIFRTDPIKFTDYVQAVNIPREDMVEGDIPVKISGWERHVIETIQIFFSEKC